MTRTKEFHHLGVLARFCSAHINEIIAFGGIYELEDGTVIDYTEIIRQIMNLCGKKRGSGERTKKDKMGKIITAKAELRKYEKSIRKNNQSI